MACYSHNEDFQNLRKTHKLQHGKNQSEIVFLLFLDRPYNLHRQQDFQYCIHYAFDMRDIEAFSTVAEKVQNRNQHWHIFCSAVHFAFWWQCSNFWAKQVEDNVDTIELNNAEHAVWF